MYHRSTAMTKNALYVAGDCGYKTTYAVLFVCTLVNSLLSHMFSCAHVWPSLFELPPPHHRDVNFKELEVYKADRSAETPLSEPQSCHHLPALASKLPTFISRCKRWAPQHQKHNQGLWECSRLLGLLGSVAGERLDSSILGTSNKYPCKWANIVHRYLNA